LKNKIPETGDSLVVSKDGHYFTGIVHSIEKDTPKGNKTLYHAIVTTVYPTLDGKLDHTIKAGDIIKVSQSNIREIIDESINNVKPDICLIIENGSIAHARRVDGQNGDINIKVVDEDEGSTRMFKANAHSFYAVQGDLDENPTFI
jgi:hypothetical protein